MKKLITICLFAFAIILGTQSLNAQEKYKSIEEMVKIETQDLKKILSLDDDQTAMVSRSLYAKEKSHTDLASNTMITKSDAQALTEKINVSFKSKMMQILTEEQFVAYGTYLSKKKTEK